MKTFARSAIFLAVCLAATHAFAQSAAAPSAAKPAPPKPAAPSVSSEPESTTASFGDWTLRCTRVTGLSSKGKLCEIVQAITIQGQSGPIAQIAIGRVNAEEPLKLTAQLPNNVTFPSTVHFAVEEKETLSADLSWKRCLPGGCYADVDVKDEQIAKWRPQADKGRLTFKDATGREIQLPFSFKGLSQALDALEKA